MLLMVEVFSLVVRKSSLHLLFLMLVVFVVQERVVFAFESDQLFLISSLVQMNITTFDSTSLNCNWHWYMFLVPDRNLSLLSTVYFHKQLHSLLFPKLVTTIYKHSIDDLLIVVSYHEVSVFLSYP